MRWPSFAFRLAWTAVEFVNFTLIALVVLIGGGGGWAILFYTYRNRVPKPLPEQNKKIPNPLGEGWGRDWYES